MSAGRKRRTLRYAASVWSRLRAPFLDKEVPVSSSDNAGRDTIPGELMMSGLVSFHLLCTQT